MTIHYRHRETGAEFEFDFVWIGTGYRIDIVSQPSYRGRPEGMHATHRLGSANSWYICWTKAIPTLDQAKTIAATWATGTVRYIATGNSQTAFDLAPVMDYDEDARAKATFARLQREQEANR